MTEPDTTARPRCRDLRPRDVIVWTGQPRPNDFAKVIERRKDDDSGWWITDGSGLADYVWDGGAAWQTVRALCDGYDEAQRLREQAARVGSCAQCGGWWLDRACGPTHAAVQAVAEHPVEVYAEHAAARQALAEAEAEAARLRQYEAVHAGALDIMAGQANAATRERDAARQALADLIGELRGSVDPYILDRYDPDLFHCVHCEQYRDVEERHGGRDTDPGYYCDACVAGP